MGYYSEVAFAIDKELYTEHKLIHNDFPEIWEKDPDNVDQNKDGYIVFYLGDIKWYDDFPSIAEAVSFMDRLDYNNCQDRYGFLRLGEDFGDQEERGDASKYDIYVNQYISIG